MIPAMIDRMARRRSPWADVAQRPGLTVRLLELPDGVRGVCRPTGPTTGIIALSAALDQVERSAVLAHELVHVRRGGPCPSELSEVWWAVEAREELVVDREVARDLVPTVEFDSWLDARVEEGDLVDAALVAEVWRVPERVAQVALELAAQRRLNASGRGCRPWCT